MTNATVRTETDGSVGTVTFSNAARLNAMTLDMWGAVPAAIAAFVEDPAIRVILLQGEGDKAFVSGADISEFVQKRGSKEATEAYNAVADAASEAVQACPKPTIAVIRGFCIGGGLGLALACDLRFASEGSRFAIPAAKLGLGYRYAGIKRLTDLVGPSRAKDIFFSARQLGSDEAERIGLVDRVVPPDGLEALVRDYCFRLAGNAPLTMRASKLAIDAATDPPMADLDAVDQAVALCFASSDYKEGRSAFAEKRPPRFTGS